MQNCAYNPHSGTPTCTHINVNAALGGWTSMGNLWELLKYVFTDTDWMPLQLPNNCYQCQLSKHWRNSTICS